MKKLKIAIIMVLAMIIGTDVLVQNVMAATTKSVSTVMAGDDEKDEKKKEEKKKDKKKKKKDKKAKTADEVIAELQALEWKKPAKTGTDIDTYYNDADNFFSLIKTVADNVTIYRPVKVQTPSGKVEVMPMDADGNIRHKNESFDQIMQSATYVIDMMGQCTIVMTGTVSNSVQIAADAVPFVGNPERKAANVQIAKATKAFPLLVDLMKSQRNMAKRYFKPKNVELSDDADDSAVQDEAEFMETLEMSDEELEKYMEAELTEG